ncbi:hypothetical protein PT974_04567 [Cladobotryum mycophilum]|uniref:BAG domain-containing protein n=1 Tax=Cladobotryum mycophilum TaxID=491253 RepID=A0ABR0SVU7_9HYPO
MRMKWVAVTARTTETQTPRRAHGSGSSRCHRASGHSRQRPLPSRFRNEPPLLVDICLESAAIAAATVLLLYGAVDRHSFCKQVQGLPLFCAFLSASSSPPKILPHPTSHDGGQFCRWSFGIRLLAAGTAALAAQPCFPPSDIPPQPHPPLPPPPPPRDLCCLPAAENPRTKKLGEVSFPRVTLTSSIAKVDSTQPLVASSGALQDIASYLNGTLVNLSTAFQESSEYISGTLGIPPTVVYSGLAALLAVPLTMTRYGWSLSREASSPYGSMTSFPEVGDDDFSYITSQELDDPGMGYSDSRYFSRSRNSVAADPEDDILLIKNKGVTYPAHFPAYSIGDGKLYVKDVRDRVGLMMDLPSRAVKHIKLLYKGKQLKESTMPVRDYGVKNKSEIMAVIPEVEDESSPSGEETVIVGEASRSDSKSRSRRKKKPKRRSDRPEGDSPISPRESVANFEPSKSPPPHVANSGPMKKLDEISNDFKTKWFPLCREYIEAPPKDAKKRTDEHRRLSESVLQHIILKLDGVETEGIIEVRTRRKDLVRQVQDILKELDVAKAS